MKNIAISTINMGHWSIAQAFAEKLQKKGYDAKVYKKKDWLYYVYIPFYQHFPNALYYPYKLTQLKPIVQTGKYITQLFYKQWIKLIKQNHYNLMINTYYAGVSSAEKASKVTHIKFLNFIANPYNIHPAEIATDYGLNLVFDDYMKKKVQKIYPQAQYETVGWLVRPEYEESYNKLKIRQKMKLKNKLTFLIVTGSHGMGKSEQLIKEICRANIKLQLIIICGKNKKLKKNLNKFAQNFDHATINLKIIGFTKKLHLYMQAANLVIGKAGPNTIFESTATLTPFFAFSNIKGNESGNLDLIKKYKLGFVNKNLQQASNLIIELAQNPSKLNQFDKPIKKMAKYNKQAIHKIEKLIKTPI